MKRIFIAVGLLVTLLTLPTGNAAAAPSRLDAPVITSFSTVRGKVDITFTETPGAAGYHVYRNGRLLETINGSPYDDRNRPGKNYSYEIEAFANNKKTRSPKSNQISADTTRSSSWTDRSTPSQPPSSAPRPTPAPTQPTGQLSAPVITNYRTVHGKVDITFTETPGAAGYHVYRNGRLLETINGSPYDDRNRPGKNYSYEIEAFANNKRTRSPKSNRVAVDTTRATSWRNGDTSTPQPTPSPSPSPRPAPAPTPAPAPAPAPNPASGARPAAPTHLSTTLARGDGVTLRWKAAAGTVHGYNVYVNGNYLKTVEGATSTGIVTRPGNYRFTVHTVAENGQISGPSQPHTRTVFPKAPRTMYVLNDYPRAGLGWAGVLGAAEYIVEVDGKKVATVGSRTTSVAVTGGYRQFSVRAVSAEGLIGAPITKNARIELPGPANVRVGRTGSFVHATWTSPHPSISNFEVYVDGNRVARTTGTTWGADLTPGRHRIVVLSIQGNAESEFEVNATVNVPSRLSNAPNRTHDSNSDSVVDATPPAQTGPAPTVVDERFFNNELVDPQTGEVIGRQFGRVTEFSDGSTVVRETQQIKGLSEPIRSETVAREDGSVTVTAVNQQGRPVATIDFDAPTRFTGKDDPMLGVSTGTITNANGKFTFISAPSVNGPVMQILDENGREVTLQEAMETWQEVPSTPRPTPSPGGDSDDDDYVAPPPKPPKNDPPLRPGCFTQSCN